MLSCGWICESGGREPTHIYPISDTYAHVTTGTDCWCNPTVDETEEIPIVTHNAADQRERYERGERKPS